jgi:formylmethanofuran dehydrogenase subunit A
MTADGPFQFGLYELTGNKWVNHDVETETTSGIVPFRYKRKSAVHATQWSIGLELALLVEDPWRIYLTTDHPNAGPFTAYPKIIAWLMSRKARAKMVKRISRRARRKSLLPSIDREYNFFDIATVTRAGQAKALGLAWKGHLGVGADADVAIYGVNPEQVDPSKKYKSVRKAFKASAYTVKGGEIVAKDGKIVKPVYGRTYWADVQLSSPFEVTEHLKRRFREYWTVEYENYLIPENFLHASAPIQVQAEA